MINSALTGSQQVWLSAWSAAVQSGKYKPEEEANQCLSAFEKKFPQIDSLPDKENSVSGKRKLILKNFQSPGDIIMLSACIRDLHAAYPNQFVTDVRTSCPEIWENNPYLTELSDFDPEVETIDMKYPIIHSSNEGAYHFIHGFSKFLEDTLKLKIPVTKFRGDIHLSSDEKSWMSMVEEHFTGKDTPFWLICSGGKTDYTAKWWIPEYAQEVVDYFKDKIQFVQIGENKTGHYHPPLKGVINLVGNTDLRQIIRLIGHTDGIVCPVTFAMHAAAAVPVYKQNKPKQRACVVTAGGREPSNFTCYTNHQYLHTNGTMKCCPSGGCWKSRIVPLPDGDQKNNDLCVNTVTFNGREVQKCMYEGVKSTDVIRSIEKYYMDGNLSYLPEGEFTIDSSWEMRKSLP